MDAEISESTTDVKIKVDIKKELINKNENKQINPMKQEPKVDTKKKNILNIKLEPLVPVKDEMEHSESKYLQSYGLKLPWMLHLENIKVTRYNLNVFVFN